ncbi:MAG: LytTR family DNA-binding domain-containing protein [Erysipelotrichaceae bacterium]
MKLRIELDPNMEDDTIVVSASAPSKALEKLQRYWLELQKEQESFVFYQNENEYYLPIKTILFFESYEQGVCAHTKDQVYQVPYKLYELEARLPDYFCRSSKSCIVNIVQITSMSRSFSNNSLVEFEKSHKKVYVSRHYYKTLKNTIREKRASI